MAQPEWNPSTWPPHEPRPPEPPRPGSRSATIVSVAAVLLVLILSVVAVFWVVFRSGIGAYAGSGAHRSAAVPPIADRAAVTPDASASAEADRGTVITVAQASQVLRTYWRSHEPALVRRDLNQLGALATGSARTWERGAVACGCYQVNSSRPLQDAAYFVPRQSTYPAYFIAEAQTEYADTPWAELLVFTKQTASARWLVAHDSGFGPDQGDRPSLGKALAGPGGYLRPVGSSTTPAQRRRAEQAATKLAVLWQQAKEQGAVPSSTEFRLDGQTLFRAQKIARFRQDRVQANGMIGHYTFFVDPDGQRYEAPEAGGYLLSCQPVRETVVYRASPEQNRIRQDPARKKWGTLLKPGTYRTVTSEDYWQTCFLVPPDPRLPIVITNHVLGGSIPRGR